jgi:hypothetical protein
MQRLTLTVVMAATAAVLTAAPAHAAFCGVPDDIAPVVKLTIATYPKIAHSNHAIDASSIRIVSINGTYGYSVTDTGSQRIPFYWEKPTGTWRFASANRAPADWSKPLLSFFQSDDSCNNPNWKKRN